MLKGIDISNWQGVFNYANWPELNFVICKSSEGTTYVDPYCDTNYQAAKQRGLLVGVYHFYRGGYEAEADFFVNQIRGYVGEAILVLDYEVELGDINGHVERFCKRVKELTGINPIVYANGYHSGLITSPWVRQNCGLWYAAWPNGSNASDWRSDYQTKAGWTCPIWQFTDNLKGTKIDGDLFDGTADTWRAYAGATAPAPTPDPSPDKPNYTVDELAIRVLQGQFGTGDARKAALNEFAGRDRYDEVQAYINEHAEWAANKVLEGYFGNNEERKEKLGPWYDLVQSIVNDKIKGNAEPTYYIVRAGDTLTAIAKKFNTTVEALRKANNLANPNYLQVGWRLLIV